jgi:hypothetical protein
MKIKVLDGAEKRIHFYKDKEFYVGECRISCHKITKRGTRRHYYLWIEVSRRYKSLKILQNVFGECKNIHISKH